MPRQDPQNLPSVIASEVSVIEIDSIFKARRSDATDWTELRVPIEFPHELETNLAHAEQCLAYYGSDELNTAASHQLLDIVITAVNMADRFNSSFSDSAPCPIWRGCFFSLHPIYHNDEHHILESEANKSLWFHPMDSMAYLDVNFVVRVAEVEETSPPLSSVLAMMWMIQSQRRDGKMPVHTMYGLAIWRENFTFLELNPHGQWSKYTLQHPLHFQEILETVAYMFKDARRLLVEYYGVRGNMSHLEGVQDDPNLACSDQSQATSRRGLCTLDMIERGVGYCDDEYEQGYEFGAANDSDGLDDYEGMDESEDMTGYGKLKKSDLMIMMQGAIN